MKKTLKEFKDHEAVKMGYKDWSDLVLRTNLFDYLSIYQKVDKIYIHQEEEKEPQTIDSIIVEILVVIALFLISMVGAVIMEISLKYLRGPLADFDFVIGWTSALIWMLLMYCYLEKLTNWIKKRLIIK